MLEHMLAELLKALLCLALITFPILIAWLPIQRRLSRSALTRIACVLAAMGATSIVLGNRGSLDHRVMPWLGHVIGTLSIFSSTGEMLGSRPVTLTLPMRVGLSLVVIAASLTLAEQMLTKPWRRKGPMQSRYTKRYGYLGPSP
jgi:hypothetical protein